MSRAFGWTLGALLAFGLEPAAARAEPDAVALARRHLLGQGAREVSELSRTFLFEGQATVHEVELSQDECVGFLALGTGEVHDVDLSIYARAGQPLAEDTAQQPFAYARVCGARGLRLYVDATLYAGRGELVVLRVDSAPRGVDRLPDEIGFAASAGGRAEQTRAVGGAVDELALDLKLEQVEKTLNALGYRASGNLLPMELRAGTAGGAVRLEADRCYRVVAYVPVSRGVALDVIAPDGTKREIRTAHDERVDLPVCAKLSGLFELRVQARPMRGVAVVRAFEHPGVRDPGIVALGDAQALAWAEADVLARERGFQLELLGQAWAESGQVNSWPVTLEAGSCHAFAVAAGGQTGVDMRLLDERGLLLARNEGRRGLPLLFACSDHVQKARLILRGRGEDGLVTIWGATSHVAGGASGERHE